MLRLNDIKCSKYIPMNTKEDSLLTASKAEWKLRLEVPIYDNNIQLCQQGHKANNVLHLAYERKGKRKKYKNRYLSQNLGNNIIEQFTAAILNTLS